MQSTLLRKKSKEPEKLEKYLEVIKNLLYESKAENIAMYDIRDKRTYCDFVIIATGSSMLHLRALCTKVKNALKEEGVFPYNNSKSIEENYWHILDYTDIVVHFLLKENRNFYKLDELFQSEYSEAAQEKLIAAVDMDEDTQTLDIDDK